MSHNALIQALYIHDDVLDIQRLQLTTGIEFHAVSLEHALPLEQVKPDVILLDLMHIDPSGLSLLAQIRDSAPVVVITESDQPDEIAQILESGASDCLVSSQTTPEMTKINSTIPAANPKRNLTSFTTR